MNSFDPLLSLSVIDELNLSKYLTKVFDEKVIENKEEALKTNMEKLKSYADIIEKSLNENYIGAIVNEEKLRENSKYFKEIIPLNKNN